MKGVAAAAVCRTCGDANCDGTNKLTLTLVGYPRAADAAPVDTRKHLCYARLPYVPPKGTEEYATLLDELVRRVNASKIFHPDVIQHVKANDFAGLMGVMMRTEAMRKHAPALSTAMGMDCDGMTSNNLSVALWFLNRVEP